MEQINKIRILSLWIFILPVVALNLCLFISVNYNIFENTIFTVDQIGRTGFTIPYIDGSVSISRTARTYPAYLVFKPCMIITALLLIKYWITTNALIQNISAESIQKNIEAEEKWALKKEELEKEINENRQVSGKDYPN